MPKFYGISDKILGKKHGISDKNMLVFQKNRIFAA